MGTALGLGGAGPAPGWTEQARQERAQGRPGVARGPRGAAAGQVGAGWRFPSRRGSGRLRRRRQAPGRDSPAGSSVLRRVGQGEVPSPPAVVLGRPRRAGLQGSPGPQSEASRATFAPPRPLPASLFVSLRPPRPVPGPRPGAAGSKVGATVAGASMARGEPGLPPARAETAVTSRPDPAPPPASPSGCGVLLRRSLSAAPGVAENGTLCLRAPPVRGRLRCAARPPPARRLSPPPGPRVHLSPDRRRQSAGTVEALPGKSGRGRVLPLLRAEAALLGGPETAGAVIVGTPGVMRASPGQRPSRRRREGRQATSPPRSWSRPTQGPEASGQVGEPMAAAEGASRGTGDAGPCRATSATSRGTSNGCPGSSTCGRWPGPTPPRPRPEPATPTGDLPGGGPLPLLPRPSPTSEPSPAVGPRARRQGPAPAPAPRRPARHWNLSSLGRLEPKGEASDSAT